MQKFYLALMLSLVTASGFCALDYRAMENAIANSSSRSGLEEVLKVLPSDPKRAIEGLAEGLYLSRDPAALFVLWQIANYHDDSTYRFMALDALDSELKDRVENSVPGITPFVTYLGQTALFNPDDATRAHATQILGKYLDAKKLNPKLSKKFRASVEAHFWPAADRLLAEFNQNNMEPLRALIEILKQKIFYFQSTCSNQKSLTCEKLSPWLEKAVKTAYSDDGC